MPRTLVSRVANVFVAALCVSSTAIAIGCSSPEHAAGAAGGPSAARPDDPGRNTGGDGGNGTLGADGAVISPDGGAPLDAGSPSDLGIAADRLMDWSVAGVPGGIPARTTVCATVTSVSGIEAAIAACPPGQVVRVAAGTYTLGGTIRNASKSGVVLRGDGPGKTIFKSSASPAFSFGSADWPPPVANRAVLSGATRGSTSITVQSTTGYRAGGLMKIGAGQNPPFVHNNGVASHDEMLAMTFRVKSVSGTTVTFEPPLPFDFSAFQPRSIPYQLDPLTDVGIEDLTVDLQGAASVGLELQQMWGSWVKNVEIKGSTGKVLTLYAVSSSEIRHCHLHDSVSNGSPNTEGLDFYRDSDWNLVEDNIVYAIGLPGIMLGDWNGGIAGNVIASNFVYGAYTPDSAVAGWDIGLSHGSNVTFNLIEGNIAGGMEADGYFGSTSHGTIFRNWITMTHPKATSNFGALKLKHFSDYFNVLGNVLGTSALPKATPYDAPETSGYYAPAVIYELGFPNIGNTSFDGVLAASTPPNYTSQGATLAAAQSLDKNVSATLVRHGNYDYVSGSIKWDPAISSRAIPSSLFRKTRPSFFGALAWPAFDPSAPPGAFADANIARIPAGYRYVHGVDP